MTFFNQTCSFCQSNLFSELVLSSTHQLKAFRYHLVWLKNVKADQGYQFSYHGVQGTHKIQLLTYSSIVQRAFEVEFSLKSKRAVSQQSSHSMTSCPQQIAVPFVVCIFGGFGEMPWRPSPPKIQGCRIDQQIQRWLKDQLQDSIANKGMAWPSRHATTIRHNIEIFQVILSNLMFR